MTVDLCSIWCVFKSTSKLSACLATSESLDIFVLTLHPPVEFTQSWITLELDHVETELLYQGRISPNFPSALCLYLSLPASRWPTLIRQTVIARWTTFSFPSLTAQTRRRSRPGCWPCPSLALLARGYTVGLKLAQTDGGSIHCIFNMACPSPSIVLKWNQNDAGGWWLTEGQYSLAYSLSLGTYDDCMVNFH